MRFVITKDYDELSQVISSTMLKHMHTDRPRVNICVTAEPDTFYFMRTGLKTRMRL